MMRLLFWIGLIVLVVAAIRSKLRSAGMSATAAAKAGRAPREVGQGEPMTACAHCHVYFPASEAVRADGHDYCSPAHLRLPPL